MKTELVPVKSNKALLFTCDPKIFWKEDLKKLMEDC